jgi:hypothetical protein
MVQHPRGAALPTALGSGRQGARQREHYPLTIPNPAPACADTAGRGGVMRTCANTWVAVAGVFAAGRRVGADRPGRARSQDRCRGRGAGRCGSARSPPARYCRAGTPQPPGRPPAAPSGQPQPVGPGRRGGPHGRPRCHQSRRRCRRVKLTWFGGQQPLGHGQPAGVLPVGALLLGGSGDLLDRQPQRDREPTQHIRARDAALALQLAGPLPGRAAVAPLRNGGPAQAAGDLG